MSVWQLSNRFDRSVLPIADRHYNRQKPGTSQFAPPGSCLVLKVIEAGKVTAFWVTSAPTYAMHVWPGAWVCSAFRNESSYLSSDLVREACAITRWHYGEPSGPGLITFINPSKVRHKRDPGRCFRKAGFNVVGFTKIRKLLVLQLIDLPPALPPHTEQLSLEVA